MKLISILMICLMAIFSSPAMAIKVTGLYQSSVPVKSESASLRNPAIKKALIQVLIKLTGDRNINKTENISGLTQSPERFVQQFRYQQVENDENPNLKSTELWVQFDENALNNALRAQGLAIWGSERPSILVWLANEDTSANRQLVSFEQNPEYIAQLDKRAAARGISLLFPLLDLEDSSQLSVSDVWAGFPEPILAASDRYQPDVILTGKLVQTLPDLWETRWTVFMDGQTSGWNSQAKLPELALEEGIDELTDRLATRYARSGTTRVEAIELVVSNINNLDAYARALSYLESLQSVTAVNVKAVSSNDVRFELISHGGFEVLNQAITLGKTLELVSNNETINYRLLPR